MLTRAVSILVATATFTEARYHEKTHNIESTLLKFKRLAHKNAIAAQKNFKRWGFDE